MGLWILNTNNGLVNDQVPENVANEVYNELVKDNVQILNGLAVDVGSVSLEVQKKERADLVYARLLFLTATV